MICTRTLETCECSERPAVWSSSVWSHNSSFLEELSQHQSGSCGSPEISVTRAVVPGITATEIRACIIPICLMSLWWIINWVNLLGSLLELWLSLQVPLSTVLFCWVVGGFLLLLFCFLFFFFGAGCTLSRCVSLQEVSLWSYRSLSALCFHKSNFRMTWPCKGWHILLRWTDSTDEIMVMVHSF